MSAVRPSDIPLPANLKKQDPQGLGKQLVYGSAELGVAATMVAVAAIEGSAAVCSQFTHSNGQNTTAPGQGICFYAETLSQGTWVPTSYGLVPYVGTAAALTVDGLRRIYNVTKVGLKGVKEDGKKAWKIFKDKATSMNKKYPAMAAGLVAGFFTSGLTVATAALGCGAYVAADLYNDYVGEPEAKKEPSGFSALVLTEDSEEEEEVLTEPDDQGAPELLASASGLRFDEVDESFAPASRVHRKPSLRRAPIHLAASAAPVASFFDAEAPATGKIRIQISGRTYTFGNIRAAFYASQYPEHAAQLVKLSSGAAEAYAGRLVAQGVAQNPKWNGTNLNIRTMYFLIGLRLEKDPTARAQLRAMSDEDVSAVNDQFNGIGVVLKAVRDWDKERTTAVDSSYHRKVAALARIPDEL